MPSVANCVMQRLYRRDIWRDFKPRQNNAEEVQGWNGNHPSLRRLVSSSSSGTNVVVDVGVWKGQSTITMANAMKAAGIDGCVIAVDTFLGSPEHWSMGGDLFERANGRPDLYETFLDNVALANLTDYVVPVPQTSVTAARILRGLGIKAAIVHIDAAHEYEEVIRDAEEYWEILSAGGYLVGDDYDQSWGGVVRAAGVFSAKVGLPLTIEPPKWILRKVDA